MVFHRCIAESIVAHQDREFSVVCQLFYKVVHAGIEIMVSHHACIISHHLHGPHFRLSFEDIEVRCSLKNITCIQQQYIGFLCPDVADDLCPCSDATHAGISGAIHRKRIQTAVHIIGMKDGQFMGR